MAENKQSFVLYTDLLKVVEKLILQDRENHTNYAGELFYHVLLYVNDHNPIPINFIIELAFEPIKCQLKRDLRKYEKIVEKRSIAGLASAQKRKQNQHMSTHVESVQQSSTNPTDNVNDDVTVNDNVNEREKEKTPTPENPIFHPNLYLIPIDDLEEFMISDSKWVENLARIHKLSTDYDEAIKLAKEWIGLYVDKLRADNLKEKSKNDCFSHCSNWIKQEKLKQNGKEQQQSNVFKA